MEIVYVTEYGTTYKLIYSRFKKNIYSKKIGKISTIITQCSLLKDDLIIGFSTAQKCYCDSDNTYFAHMVVTRKVLPFIKTRKTRKNIWKLLHEKFI